jgi:benzoate membrane transport protein
MVRGLLADFHPAAFWAGITAFIWYAFGAVPIQIAVADRLGLSGVQTSSWIFIVWTSGAVASVILSILYRQPIPITWSIPGMVYLGTLAGQFSVAELAGANLMAGVLLLVLGLLGVGGRMLALLPLPIAMGMFAGSILGDVLRLVTVTVQDFAIAGVTVIGYLLGRLVARPRVPPVGLAVVFGAAAVILTQQATPALIVWTAPAVAMPALQFTPGAFAAVSIPLVVLALGLGNVQGLGFLMAQGYRPPADRITVVIGLNSVVNALLGGHTAILARTGVAIVASRDAGPLATRYWANLVAAVSTLLIAFAASPVASLLGVLPRSYIIALGGLAILSSFQDALERAFGGPMRFGSLVAFLAAATPFSVFGITSAFWALLAGLCASLIAERTELLAFWRGGTSEVPAS